MGKKLLLMAVTLVSLATGASAQQGTWMLYGSGGYDKEKYTENSLTPAAYNTEPLSLLGWTANVGIGCQFSKHFMVGAIGGVGRQDGASNYYYTNSAIVMKYTEKIWEAGVFGRYTSWLSKRFFFYTQLTAFKYAESRTQEQLNQATAQPYTNSYPASPDGNGITVSLFPAIGATVWKGYGVNMDIGGIGYSTYNAFAAASRHHFYVTLGQQFSFGIHKIIGWQRINAMSKDAAGK